jgi:sugar lactone lactonase YvrE
MRGNDGAVDSRGRFWLGMMTDLKLAELQNEGVLFRLDPDLSLHRMIEDMGISNGLGWNHDETIMYVTDTVTGNIFAYDFDVETGAISNRRVFYAAPEGTPPDGFAMDEEGCLWVALWSGSRVVRVSPEGKLIGEIAIPARCVSCAEFAGTDLYITTADVEPTPDPYGGKLYKVNVGVRGKPRNNFKLQKAAAQK